MSQSPETLLEIKRLSVEFGRDTRSRVVHDVDLMLARGEKLALVGESGSGKSVTAMSILNLHEHAQTHYPSGEIKFKSRDLLRLNEDALRAVRGKEIAFIPQEPMTALNPLYTVGDQLIEPLRVHEGLTPAAARSRMLELLRRTGITDPEQRFESYPHMLSGGQRQRVMIAMALACHPQLLIADEPTTAVDVTVQLQILDLLNDLQREFGMAVLLITHDLNIVRRFADTIYVMRAGRVVERAPVDTLFRAPQDPYTRHLLASQPEALQRPTPTTPASAHPIIRGSGLRCYFPIKGGFWRRRIGEVKAVDDVSLVLPPGQTLGIVGESGSGKSTLGMCLLRLQRCDGEIEFERQALQKLSTRELRPLRKDFQVVFQDPYSSLSPRMTVAEIVDEGLGIHFPEFTRQQRRARIVAAMKEVGLEESMLTRYPHEFSGGQRQRIAIARTIVLEPKLLLLDEPTSALDVSVQKQVLELLLGLQARRGLSYVFISHDLKVIRAMANRVLVMRHGRVVEEGATETLFTAPRADYTRELLRASLLPAPNGQ